MPDEGVSTPTPSRRDAYSVTTIKEVLGHGGFGIVYEVRHSELKHLVSIKVHLPSTPAAREGTATRAKSAGMWAVCDDYWANRHGS